MVNQFKKYKCKCMSFGNCTFPTRQYLMSTGEEDISVNQVCEQFDLCRSAFHFKFQIWSSHTPYCAVS